MVQLAAAFFVICIAASGAWLILMLIGNFLHSILAPPRPNEPRRPTDQPRR